MEDLIEFNADMGNSVSRRLTVQTYIIIAVMILTILAAVLLSTRFAQFAANLFVEPIHQINDASAKLAQGDLNIEIEPLYPDELGEMTISFKEAADIIKLYISELSRGLGEVASGNFDVSSNVDFKGDFSALTHALDAIIVELSETLLGYFIANFIAIFAPSENPKITAFEISRPSIKSYKSQENCSIVKGFVPLGDLPCPRVSKAITLYLSLK